MNKKSIVIQGHYTSISLEPEFWQALNFIKDKEKTSLSALILKIETGRLQKNKPINLSSAIRVFILEYYQAKNNN